MKKTHPFWSMFARVAKDASPEDIEELASLAPKDAEVEAPAQQQEENAALADIAKRLSALEATVAELVKSDKAVHEELPTNELDALEKELEGEDVVEVPPEEIKNEDEEAEGMKTITADSNAFALAMLREMKPIIASMKDPTERKKATDALVSKVKKFNTQGKPNGYAIAAKAKAKDSAEKNVDPAQLGKDIQAKHNPHYAKK